MADPPNTNTNTNPNIFPSATHEDFLNLSQFFKLMGEKLQPEHQFITDIPGASDFSNRTIEQMTVLTRKGGGPPTIDHSFGSSFLDVSSITEQHQSTLEELAEALKDESRLFTRNELRVVPFSDPRLFDFYSKLKVEEQFKHSIMSQVRTTVAGCKPSAPEDWNSTLDTLTEYLLFIPNNKTLSHTMDTALGGFTVTKFQLPDSGLFPWFYVQTLDHIHRKTGTLAVNPNATFTLTGNFVADYYSFKVRNPTMTHREINDKFLEKLQANSSMFKIMNTVEGAEDIRVSDNDSFQSFLRNCDKKTVGSKSIPVNALDKVKNKEYNKEKKAHFPNGFSDSKCRICRSPHHSYTKCKKYLTFKNALRRDRTHGPEYCGIHGHCRHPTSECKAFRKLREDPVALAKSLSSHTPRASGNYKKQKVDFVNSESEDDSASDVDSDNDKSKSKSKSKKHQRKN